MQHLNFAKNKCTAVTAPPNCNLILQSCLLQNFVREEEFNLSLWDIGF